MSDPQFSDLDNQFRPTDRGDIDIVAEAKAIEQSLINILMTQKGERPLRPEFGTNLREAVFDPLDEVTNDFIYLEVQDAFEQEERAQLTGMEVKDKGNYTKEILIKWTSPFLDETQKTFVILE